MAPSTSNRRKAHGASYSRSGTDHSSSAAASKATAAFYAAQRKVAAPKNSFRDQVRHPKPPRTGTPQPQQVSTEGRGLCPRAISRSRTLPLPLIMSRFPPVLKFHLSLSVTEESVAANGIVCNSRVASRRGDDNTLQANPVC
jgi:hypothetical protein